MLIELLKCLLQVSTYPRVCFRRPTTCAFPRAFRFPPAPQGTNPENHPDLIALLYEACVGLGRIVASHHRSSTSYQICEHIRYLYF